MNADLGLSRLPRVLMVGVAVLLAVEALVGVARLLDLIHGDGLLVELFDLRLEGNVPTWYSSLLLALNAITLALITRLVERRREAWSLGAGMFLLLSADEVAQVHERLAPGWVVAGGLAFALSMAWIAADVAPATRRRLAAALLFYLAGAAGIDAVSPLLFDGAGIVSGLLILFEEGLEMIGAVLLLSVWIAVLERRSPTWGPPV